MKKAFITGITGQDGSYLAELLLEKGYEVHGVVRRVALEYPQSRLRRILHIQDRLVLHSASMESYASLFNIIADVQPDECYHLAAQSFVSYSFEDEFSTIQTNLNGTHYMLSSLKRQAPDCRFYFAGSSEVFGNASLSPQDESTPYKPRSPYGISKMAGMELTRNYREAYGMFAVSGILFNHESPRRGAEFVTRKISMAAARIRLGLESTIRLGNIEARRDWGHARDSVSAMWAMLQQDAPRDYVIATGATHSVRDFLDLAFRHVGLDYREHLVVDKTFYRPAEVHVLCGNASRARRELGWEPKVDFETLVREMVDHDMALFAAGGPPEMREVAL